MVEGYEWSTATGFVQEVTDANLVVELLTEPYGAFVIDRDDAICALAGIGPQRAANMALAGVVTLADLAALDEAGIKRLDIKAWASAKQIRAWVQQAREILHYTIEDQEAEA
jgi:predicted flap endonuclease-1-like 5' DNA nuclease